MDVYEKALALHAAHQGKYEIKSKVSVANFDDLSLAYSPGVAAPCKAIAANPADVYTYTAKGNTIAVISDGSAVLGLGNIGPHAGLPVMEGKAILFKEFAGINAIPLCLNTQNVEEIIATCKFLEPSLGGINLEDISAPRCFEVERRLKAELNIPVFHDDQHGTAIVLLAALINANRLSGKPMASLKVVISGLGAAGVAIARILHQVGVTHITAIRSTGVVNNANCPNAEVQSLLDDGIILDSPHSSLAQAMQGADCFVGVSAPKMVTSEMVKSMNQKPYIFAMANPEPEILPELAHAAGAFVVGTGRSDYPNQINNVLAFPGIFKGALAMRTQISDAMKVAAATAIAGLISDDELKPEFIIPPAFDKRVVEVVSAAVINATS